jgi:hypothetical protein
MPAVQKQVKGSRRDAPSASLGTQRARSATFGANRPAIMCFQGNAGNRTGKQREILMKKLAFAASILLVVTSVAHAQETPVADVAVGYGLIEVPQGYTFMMHGGSGSVAWNVNNWLGIVGDFGAYHAHPGVSLTAETYTFGPRFSYRALDRFTPFAQVLVGGQHASAVTTGFTNASNAFTVGAGAGFDIGLDGRGRFALRPQLEYFGFRANGTTTTTLRLSVGIVFRIGKKG